MNATHQTVHRATYRAQIQPGQEAAATAHLQKHAATLHLGLETGDLLTFSVFRWGTHLFAYWESIDRAVDATELFDDMDHLLESWPGADSPRLFVPMLDIFHYQTPANVEHWQRRAPVARNMGRLARLNPHLASSYIFYHYQMQEERPGSGDKYGLICLHENLIFFYQEQPAIVEPAPIPGKLQTTNTPDHWQDVMFPHFKLWEDAAPGQEIWRVLELIVARTT